jgi:hypothetical protein
MPQLQKYAITMDALQRSASKDTPNEMLFMSVQWDDVSELRPLMGQLFIPQAIWECGQQWWNDTDRGKVKNSEKKLSQYNFVHH